MGTGIFAVDISLVYRLDIDMQEKNETFMKKIKSAKAGDRPARYPLKVQAIRSKGQEPRLYVYFPLPLAAALGLGAGERVRSA